MRHDFVIVAGASGQSLVSLTVYEPAHIDRAGNMTLSYSDKTTVSLLALALAAPGLAVAADTQTRTVGPQLNGSIVASDNQLLTPAGTVVELGSPVRAKAVAVNPNKATHSAAVLLMSAAEPVIVFDTRIGAVLQRYVPVRTSGSTYTPDPTGSFTGITYSSDGSKLLFSADDNYVEVANVDPFKGLLTYASSVPVPLPPANPLLYDPYSADPGGLALVDDSVGLVALSANNSLGVIDLANGTLTGQIPVGNAPNRVAVKGDFAYVTNEGGRPATSSDFTTLSDGTPIVANPTTGSSLTGTVSVVNVRTGKLATTINVGLHPAGETISGSTLYVANAYSDTLSVIDTQTRTLTRTIDVAPAIPGAPFSGGADDVAVVGTTAYVTLGEANAVAVVDLTNMTTSPVLGYIPTEYFPTSIAYDKGSKQLVVSNDKGTGAQGSIGTAHGVSAFNTHQDTGTISLIPIPTGSELATMTARVIKNNAWNSANTRVAPRYANGGAAPVAVPLHIGEPSLIKHVWYIIKENRTYDQMLGDVAQGNGDPSLAVFAGNVPNQHAIIQRFPLLDNLYAPSRQSADGHPWTIEAGSFYSNDILSPDWIRSYPGGNDNDALTFTASGYIWTDAVAKGLNVKLYGEWSDGSVVANNPATGQPYSWADFYNTSLYDESGGTQGKNVVPPGSDSEQSQIPAVNALLDPHYPSFNLGIPDQYRMDYYIPILQAQDAAGNVPSLTVMWLPDDHTNGTTTGTPLPNNYEADNDLALGRLVEAISHSSVWSSSAIFVTEDDSQDGVDHVDGHREPAYIISPYAVPPQSPGVGQVIKTTYTVVNMERTIENILGLQPMSQFDTVASPMFDCFTNTPNDAPFTHVAANTALNIGPGGTPIAGTGPANYTMNLLKLTPMQKAWNVASNFMTRGKIAKADSVDENFLNHAIWYSATNWTRPYPGEAKVEGPARFVKAALRAPVRDSDD